MPTEPIIAVENLSKRYRLGHVTHTSLRDLLSHGASGLWSALRARRAEKAAAATEEFWALRDVNFSINQGDVVGIIGRNGAGKSTLLKILSRITEPTTGRITLRGRVASLLEVGTGFHGELSGRENIFLNGAILGMTRAETRQKFDEIVAFAEVEKFLDTPVKRYSSGMYVRLAFAVAAHLEPEILIVDEVLAVGDAAFQKKCLGKMREVSAGHGRTVLVVSHNIDTILSLCGSALLMKAGQLDFFGAATEAVARYSLARTQQVKVIDCREKSRPHWVRRGIYFVSLTAHSSAKPWQVFFGQDLAIRLEIGGDLPPPKWEVYLAFFSASGVEVAAVQSQSFFLESLANTGRFLECSLQEFRLTPGSYSLHVGLRAGPLMEDFLADIATIDVLHTEDTLARQTASFCGFYVPISRYSLTPAPSHAGQ